MNILIVGLVNNPQLLRVIEEGKKRGHEVFGCYVSDLIIEASTDNFSVSLKSSPSAIKRPPVSDFDLIYLWSVGKRRWDWYVASEYLNKNHGTIIVNSKVIDNNYNYYLASSSDYLKQTENKLPFPETAVIFSVRSVDNVIGKFRFPLIVKISEGRQGKGVFKVNDLEELKVKVKELLVENPSVVLRKFIPNDGDIRIFTVGFKAIGAMRRVPTKEGEFRSNISQGGRGENYNLEDNPEIKQLAEKLSEITRTEIAGVDIMINKETGKPYILEINPGPQFTGFEKYTGINAAGAIIEYFEKLNNK
jgi:RimK family alpha-L-glutamate ligase